MESVPSRYTVFPAITSDVDDIARRATIDLFFQTFFKLPSTTSIVLDRINVLDYSLRPVSSLRMEKEMRCVISIPGILCAIESSLILSLACSQRSTDAKETNALHLCTRHHCEDCSRGEFSKCTDGAVSNRCGDLCGCCHSCVRFRDRGESCGSQLAVRSSEYFENRITNVTILATTSCRKGLICRNFACERLYEKINVDIGGEEKMGDAEKNASRWFIDNSSSINSTNEILSTVASGQNKNFGKNIKKDVDRNGKISFDPSGHLVNVIIAAREFQFIFGYRALEDFNLLIKSIEKNEENSIIKDHEVAILLERFKDAIEFVNSNERKFIKDMGINSSLTFKKQISGPWRQTQNFSEIQSGLREKRESDKESQKTEFEIRQTANERESDDKAQKEFGGISVYDIVNKTPWQMEDFNEYLIARKIEKYPQDSPSVGATDSDETGSEINILITGVPKMTNVSLEEVEADAKNDAVDEKSDEIHVNDENSEIFGSTENNDVTTVPTAENVTNHVTPEITEDEKAPSFDTLGETTGSRSNDDEKAQFIQNSYEFTFPENPVTLETDNDREIKVILNETVDDFKAQLNRIEARAIVIENAVFDMKRKIDVNQRHESVEDQKTREKHVNGLARDAKIPGQRNVVRLSNATPYARPDPDGEGNGHFAIKDTTRLANRAGQRRRTIRTRPDAFEAPRASRTGNRRANERVENQIIESSMSSRRSKFARDPKYPDERHRKSSPSGSSSLKFFKILPRPQRQRKFPIFVSSGDSSRADFLNYRHSDPRLFSRELSTLDVNSHYPGERSLWPVNLVLDRAFPVDRTDRRVEEEARVRSRNFESETPEVGESIVLLETQIPRSVSSGDSMMNDQAVGESSMRIIKTREDKGTWNWREKGPSLNLFDVSDGNSEFGSSTSGSEIPETLILPIDGWTMNRQESPEEAENGYSMSSIHLDHTERPRDASEKDGAIFESELSGSLLNPEENEGESPITNRKKRGVTIDDWPSKVETTNEEPSFFANFEKPEDYEKLHVDEKMVHDAKSPWKKSRSRRSVQMMDWLRAAQEYHERLRQMRSAAIKTWLASQEILNDANLTNVKLFTSEIPPYLDKYKMPAFRENFDGIIDEMNQDYSTKFHDLEGSIPDSSEVLTDIFAEYSSPGGNVSGRRSSGNVDVRSSELSNLSGRRKFTIITNGNSTLRVEEIPSNKNGGGLEDQLSEGSMHSRVSQQLPASAKEGDYFDHMYEGFDADDEDFNYEDPSLTTSVWSNQFDKIDSSVVNAPKKDEKFQRNLNEDEPEDSSSRLKRDSPLILFKVKGNPKKEIVIWPANWRGLIDRHLRLNRSGDATQRTTRRKSYTRLRKIDPRLAYH